MQKQGQIHGEAGGNMVKQPLKGDVVKHYEVINNFNNGYNNQIADDLITQNTFKSLNNFIPSKEGNLRKRPSLLKSYLYDLFRAFDSKSYSIKLEAMGDGVGPEDFKTMTVEEHVDYINKVLFNLEDITITNDGNIIKGTMNTLLNLTIINDNHFFEDLRNYTDLLHGRNTEAFINNHSLSLIALFKIDFDNGEKGLNIVRLFIECDNPNTIRFVYNVRYTTYDIDNQRYKFGYDGDDIIEPTVYNNKYYIMNGKDALIEINRNIEIYQGVTAEDDYVINGINEISSLSTDLYKPTAIEVSNVGFNIMAKDPVSYVDVTGTADAIRGVFYILNGEPTQIIPYNKPFNIHILQTGSGQVETPKYRIDNGDIDENTNPYKDLPGKFNEDKTVFECSGLDIDGNYELFIKKGETTFITYFKMGVVTESTVGRIDDIKKLVFKSKYCKVINNQLILYGGHGYMFFSDYNNFKYFPNYYNLYVAETSDEYVYDVAYFRQFYAIFTNKRLKRMSGTFNSSDFGLYPLNDFVGCVNGHTVKQIENLLYFMAPNGLYMLKQGYVGEGTENVVQADLPIYGSYNIDAIKNGVTIQNYYIISGDDEAIVYNFVTNAFYKFTYRKDLDLDANGKPIYSSNKSMPFQYAETPNTLYYGFFENNYNEANEIDNRQFDIMLQDFSEESSLAFDNYKSFNSTLETPSLSMGYPTNIKKYKQIYLKMYTEYGKYIPLYVKIIVDDKVIVDPKDYKIVYDKDTKTYSYVYKMESNTELKGYHVLGTLELGEDVIGKRTLQILKLRVNAKGRGIKIILSDCIPEDDKDYTDTQNISDFELAAIGIVYKLKKVKEG